MGPVHPSLATANWHWGFIFFMSHKGTTQAEMQPNEEKQIKTAYRRTNTHAQCGDWWNKKNMGHIIDFCGCQVCGTCMCHCTGKSVLVAIYSRFRRRLWQTGLAWNTDRSSLTDSLDWRCPHLPVAHNDSGNGVWQRVELDILWTFIHL